MLLRDGISLILLLMSVLAILGAATGSDSGSAKANKDSPVVTVIKHLENETVKSAKSLTLPSKAIGSGRTKKSSHKSTPITYITTLADAGHMHYGGRSMQKKNGKAHEEKSVDHQPPVVQHHHQQQQQQKKAKKQHHHSEKSAGKSLEVTSFKEPQTNPELFSKLGLSKLHVSSSHQKKRLAVESRHHGRPDDSHMFVIKLPPNPYYYTNNGPVPAPNAIEDVGKKVPVGFKSNGKPGRIYHWNIPVLKKILGGGNEKHVGGRNPNSRHHDNIDELIDIKDIPTWSKPWENEALDKSVIKFGAPPAANGQQNDLMSLQGHGHGHLGVDKLQKKKSPTYYAPIKAKKSANGKYYASNGKPHSFYVIEKSQKNLKFPIEHHKLIP